MHDSLSDTVQIYGVAWSGDDASYQSFVERHGLSFANLDDSSAEVFQRFGVASQPAWVFVTRDGTATLSRGALSQDDLTRALRALAAS